MGNKIKCFEKIYTCVPFFITAILPLSDYEWVNIEKVAILAENLVLKKYKNGYTATFEKEELLTFKGSSVSGILFHTVDQKQREIPIEFKIKEDLYLP